MSKPTNKKKDGLDSNRECLSMEATTLPSVIQKQFLLRTVVHFRETVGAVDQQIKGDLQRVHQRQSDQRHQHGGQGRVRAFQP